MPAERRYLVVGGGRVARNMLAYLGATGAAHAQWARRDSRTPLANAAASADHVLLAVSDAAIDALARDLREAGVTASITHFSAVADTAHAGALHPAAAFPQGVFDLDTLKSIPFAQIEGGQRFADIFPDWRNPVLTIAPEQRALYHALLVISGNLCSLIWNETAKALEGELKLAAGPMLENYIRTNLALLREAPTSSFSGPVTRGDAGTLRANLAALDAHPELKRCYDLMLELRWPGGAKALKD